MTTLSKSTPQVQSAETAVESAEALKYYSATQWQLIWARFRHHRAALFGASVLGFLMFIGIFANFFAPYGTGATDSLRDANYLQAPPQLPLFKNGDGFSWGLHIPAMTTVRNPVTLKPEPTPLGMPIEPSASCEEDCIDPIYRSLHWFVHGDPYKLLGFIPTDIHFFGANLVDREALTDKYGAEAVAEIAEILDKAEEKGGKVHLFGTDILGNDMFSQLLFATRVSLSIGVFGVFIAFILGLVIGGVAGYAGGWADYVIQRFTEIVRVVPAIPLYMGLAAALPKEWSNIRVYFFLTLILGFLGWPTLARRIRGQLLALRDEDYVLSARLSGASAGRIISRHMLPAFTSYIIVDLVISFPYMILSETALSFVGLGLRRPTLSWGVLLQDAQSIRAIEQAPWLFIPALFVVIGVLAFTVVGDGLRDAADPYQVNS